MDTLTAIRERRSIKKYDPNHKMTDSEINTLMEQALLSPTSFNMQNWRFVVVKDQEIKDKLKAVSFNQSQVSDASIVVVICGDLKASEKNPQRYWRNTPETVQKQIVPMIGGFYNDKPQLQRDEVMRSSGMAGQNIMLAAKAMGYDTCPMIGFDPEKVAKIINLPEDYILSFMVVVGKAIEGPNPRSGQLDFSEVVSFDSF
ncbi:nitroreductase family protein [Cyanobacterium stanieri LEGE 03274]|uniref:Nitroreductase family protein n=1 Tax=Cyanobacterium stanieri LEGE 03274 TaxID=1828756 RepID=A0ABR9V7A5_9CHRO|nr:nitroreductase family protein [Cyanobacterium stanieri]MBE9223775.1 nitroreductase family protein [Cyanobacterium stanieri LEGE 03274]